MRSDQIRRAYGCVTCQTWHAEGDELFAEHLYYQSKHGVQEWTERTWAMHRLRQRKQNRS